MYCVWYERRRPTTDGAYWFRRSTDGGATWSAEALVTTGAARLQDMSSASTLGTVSPSIAAAGGNLWVTWVDYRDGNYEVYLRRSTDCGASWESETRLTNAADTSCFANLALHEGRLHAVFSDRRNGNYEIYYKGSTDLGVTWSADERLTDDPAVSTRPSVAAGDSAVHVVWCDDRDGNFEIYHKRGDLGQVPVEEGTKGPAAVAKALPTAVRGVLFLPQSLTPDPRPLLLDASGRRVLTLHSGRNDLGRLAPGVYFYRLGNTRPRRIVIAH